jgi:hypothetical protein
MGKNLEGNRCRLIELPGGKEKSKENLRTTRVPTQIRTGYFPNSDINPFISCRAAPSQAASSIRSEFRHIINCLKLRIYPEIRRPLIRSCGQQMTSLVVMLAFAC